MHGFAHIVDQGRWVKITTVIDVQNHCDFRG